MDYGKKFKILSSERGVSLIITFFIMVIILSVVLSISALLYSEVKVIRNIGNSVVSFYAGESGIEKVLYYDRQVRPLIYTSTICDSDLDCDSGLGQICDNGLCAAPLARGLCSMFDVTNNPNYCASGSIGETSIYCNNINIPPLTGSCAPNNCTNCTIYFETSLNDNRKYQTTAKLTPSVNGNPSDYDLEINSKGIFGTAQRQIQSTSTTTQP